MRFAQLSAAALLSSAVSVSVSAQAAYGKGKAGISKQNAGAQYIPGRFIVEFAKPDGFRTAEDVSFPSPIYQRRSLTRLRLIICIL